MPNFWERHFLRYEFIVGLVVAVAFVVWCEKYDGLLVVAAVLKGNRAPLYGTLASILGALLGFAITTVSIVIAFMGEKRLQLLTRTIQYKTLWQVLTSAIRWLGFATVAAIAALMLDRDDRPTRIALYFCVWTLAMSLLRLGRSVWVLENLIAIVTKPARAR